MEQVYVLEKCPDPTATVTIKLHSELLGEQDVEKDLMSDNESMNMSTSSFRVDDLP